MMCFFNEANAHIFFVETIFIEVRKVHNTRYYPIEIITCFFKRLIFLSCYFEVLYEITSETKQNLFFCFIEHKLVYLNTLVA